MEESENIVITSAMLDENTRPTITNLYCPTCGRKHEYLELPDYLLTVFRGTMKNILALLIAGRKSGRVVSKKVMLDSLFPGFEGLSKTEQTRLADDARLAIFMSKEKLALFGWKIVEPSKVGYYWLSPVEAI